MSEQRIAVIGSAVPGIEADVIAAPDVDRATFRSETDQWTVSGVSGERTFDLLILCSATVNVAIARLDPRVEPPTSVGPESASSAYLGMLVDGVPNLVLIDSTRSTLQTATLRVWLGWMYTEMATRIMSRPPVTARWIHKGSTPPARVDRDAIDLSNDHVRDEGVFAGTAVLQSGEYEAVSAVRLAGHMEPLDGKYHWYGTVDDRDIGAALKKMPRGSVTVRVDDGDAVPVMVTDKTVWGTYRLVGVGAPPFPL